ncbi:hypothetical protein WG219_17450 [Ectopseudomonas mendocina]|uniref:Uncharacterized protein n=1 Tax=Ectopseudomonas mendocina TaxID=300 RepID=A0ABZ2RK34_ECTME
MRLVVLLTVVVFIMSSSLLSDRLQNVARVDGRVVVEAPVLTALWGGDRFLAANTEAIRLLSTGVDTGRADTGYLIRASRVISVLNPCHEDNYYLSNGLLTWGGAEEASGEVLKAAIACRSWDDVPAFFYGFNQAFFKRNVDQAVELLNIAAGRSKVNSSAYSKLAIMLQVENIVDDNLALGFLVSQRDNANDPKLRAMLDKRVERLQGLLKLREGQLRYESKYGRLNEIQELVDKGTLDELPVDPLRLGYEIRNGRVELKKFSIAGTEELP